jgi:hypothetical protein
LSSYPVSAPNPRDAPALAFRLLALMMTNQRATAISTTLTITLTTILAFVPLLRGKWMWSGVEGSSGDTRFPLLNFETRRQIILAHWPSMTRSLELVRRGMRAEIIGITLLVALQ